MQGSQEVGGLKSPGRGRSQRYVIDRLSEKSSVVTEPWERLLEVVGVVSLLCDWQRERKQADSHLLHAGPVSQRVSLRLRRAAFAVPGNRS
uniref:Uncharacterized protein n=1 Tax=Cyprinus carpio carpio TaxID=630221 RepID=A0A9J7XUF2_CYPCA